MILKNDVIKKNHEKNFFKYFLSSYRKALQKKKKNLEINTNNFKLSTSPSCLGTILLFLNKVYIKEVLKFNDHWCKNKIFFFFQNQF